MVRKFPSAVLSFLLGFVAAVVACGDSPRRKSQPRLPELATAGESVTVSYVRDGKTRSHTMRVEKVVPPPGDPATDPALWTISFVRGEEARRTSLHCRPTDWEVAQPTRP